MKKRFKKVTVTLKAEKNVMRFINQCLGIVGKMQDNKLFKQPPVSYNDVLKAIKELRMAEDETRTRLIGAAQERDNHLDMVKKLIRSLHYFVQDVADDAETEKKANVLIIASGSG